MKIMLVCSSFESFCQVMDQCTENYECLVINNNSKSNKLQDQIFWYKAEPVALDWVLKNFGRFQKKLILTTTRMYMILVLKDTEVQKLTLRSLDGK